MTTRPFFVVSSGRCGTQTMERLLGSDARVEMHHEYLCTHVQPLAFRVHHGLVSAADARAELARLHGAAVALSDRPLWGDSSNKLSWLVRPLVELFPDARFVHLVRDGRKVASSYFHKLADECYDDRSVAAIVAWLDGDGPEPPPEKRYWWPVPPPGSPFAERFRRFDRFERICWHWREVNLVLFEQLEEVEQGRRRLYRLEDLVADPAPVRDLVEFLGLGYRDELFASLQRPHNVGVPIDRLLDAEQLAKLDAIAGDMMARLGYDARPEYRMQYEAVG